MILVMEHKYLDEKSELLPCLWRPKRGFYAKTSFSNPNQAVFVPELNQTINTVLSQHKVEHLNINLQHKVKFQHMRGFSETYIATIYSAD